MREAYKYDHDFSGKKILKMWSKEQQALYPQSLTYVQFVMDNLCAIFQDIFIVTSKAL